MTNGDIFLGKDAAKLGLVDRLMTSDEYIAEKIRSGDRVLRLHKYDKSRVGMRLSPLDLFLLKSNNLLGKNAIKVLMRGSLKMISRVMRFGATFAAIKFFENSYQMNTRQRPEDNI
jgi:ClpP class serine protease